METIKQVLDIAQIVVAVLYVLGIVGFGGLVAYMSCIDLD